MLNKYPAWKYILIILILAVGVIYALPNLYGEDPALQVSGTRNTEVSLSTQETIREALSTAGITPRSIALENKQILVRFDNTDDQLKAINIAREILGRDYITALNLASRTPEWLLSVNALPMYLGLDLREIGRASCRERV